MRKLAGLSGQQIAALFLLFALASISSAVSSGKAPRSTPLPERDAAAIKRTIGAYQTAWLAGDEEAVLKTLTDDAVLMPPHGSTPISGRGAIKMFWWPNDAPPTKITKLNITIDEVGGSCAAAYARGRDEVAWSSEQRGTTSTHAHTGYYLNIMRKLPDGTWRISHHMWDDPVTQKQ